jgi:hypothetical protein
LLLFLTTLVLLRPDLLLLLLLLCTARLLLLADLLLLLLLLCAARLLLLADLLLLLFLRLTTLLLLCLNLLLLLRRSLLTRLLALSVAFGVTLLRLSGTSLLLVLFCFLLLWWLFVASPSPVTLCARINGEAEQQGTGHCRRDTQLLDVS